MDRFGYLGILKTFKKISDYLKDGVDLDESEVAKCVISRVRSVLGSKDAEELSEGLGDALKKWLAIASVLAIPAVLPQDALAKNLSKTPGTISSQNVQNAIVGTQKNQETYNGFTEAEIINILARTLYREGSQEEENGRKAILFVIGNRAGWNKDGTVRKDNIINVVW